MQGGGCRLETETQRGAGWTHRVAAWARGAAAAWGLRGGGALVRVSAVAGDVEEVERLLQPVRVTVGIEVRVSIRARVRIRVRVRVRVRARAKAGARVGVGVGWGWGGLGLGLDDLLEPVLLDVLAQYL